jgi:hypothetical protein
MSEVNGLDLRRVGIGFGLLGFVLAIIGAIFITIETDYEFGCEDLEFIQEKYDEFSEESLRECVSDWESSKTISSFLKFISPVFILFGILLLVYEKETKE